VKAAAVPLALVPALGAVQGGFQPDAWVWAGALAAWAAAVAALASSDTVRGRTPWLWLAAAIALLLWTLLSTVWSLRPALSLLEARRTLVYAAVILALVLLVRAGSTRTIAAATLAGTAGLVLYALFRYLLTERRRDPFELYDLSQPLGYANAVGILAALAILLALGVSVSEQAASRRAGAAAIPPLALALTLSGSNASWLALGAGLVVTVAILPAPQRLLATLAVLVLPTAALVALGRYSRFAADTPSPRMSGAALAAAALAGAAVATAAIPLAGRVRALPGRRFLVAALVVLALAGAAAVGRAGATEPRASYWSVAWHDYTRHPLLGSGAGTFGFAWARSGRVESRGGALDAHSLYVETLAELGPVGLALVVAMLAVPLAVAVRTRQAPYAAGAYAAFVVHAGLDWDWELPAVVVAALACGAALLATRAVRTEPLSARARAALVAAALALAAGALAGVRSHAEPGATRAPLRGALVQPVVSSSQRYLL
jgi:O-antigen ligase